MFHLTRIHRAPLRVGVPFFDAASFRPKTNVRLTHRSLIGELQGRLGSDTYRKACFIRKGHEFLIVVKNKVCGIYSPVLCLPPPLAHTAMAREDMIIRGGMSVEQYIECLEGLGDDYRSFLFYGMHHGCIFLTFDREGKIPAGSKLGVQYFRSRTVDSPVGDSVGGDASKFARRFGTSFDSSCASTRVSTLSSVDSGRGGVSEDSVMQAGFHSTYYRDILQVLGDCYADEIDVCPTWWRRSSFKVGSADEDILRRLGSVAGHVSRISSPDELSDESAEVTAAAFPMNLRDDRRWTFCPTAGLFPNRVLHDDNSLNQEGLLARVREGSLLLDF